MRPLVAALASISLLAIVGAGASAAGYMLLKEKVDSSVIQQTLSAQAYEDRIASLRAELDRMTSRQTLDRQDVERRVAALMARQEELLARQGQIAPLLDRSDSLPDELPVSAPAPSPRPLDTVTFGNLRLGNDAVVLPSPAPAPRDGAEIAMRDPTAVFAIVDRTLKDVETQQTADLQGLAESTYREIDTIASVLEDLGIDARTTTGSVGMGGPLLGFAAQPIRFEAKVRDLDSAMRNLEQMKTVARTMPIFHPAPGQQISSRFGVRRDPLLGTPAQHSGIDFRARTGAAIKAAGSGTVIFAGWNGGYGRMVEIDHGNGMTTRYAHMSSISVKEGASVEPGDLLGKVGSTGRSTGPHLHFEIRRHGDALDPMTFIRAGRKLSGLI